MKIGRYAIGPPQGINPTRLPLGGLQNRPAGYRPKAPSALLAMADEVIEQGSFAAPHVSGYGPIAAPDACDGTSAVGESRHRVPKAHQPTEPCLETHNAALAEYIGRAALVFTH